MLDLILILKRIVSNGILCLIHPHLMKIHYGLNIGKKVSIHFQSFCLLESLDLINFKQQFRMLLSNKKNLAKNSLKYHLLICKKHILIQHIMYLLFLFCLLEMILNQKWWHWLKRCQLKIICM